MHRQTVEFAVTRNKGSITRSGIRTSQKKRADKSPQITGRMVHVCRVRFSTRPFQ